MTRYEECLRAVRGYVARLRAAKVNEWNMENLVRSYVERPAFDVTYRDRLVRDALDT